MIKLKAILLESINDEDFIDKYYRIKEEMEEEWFSGNKHQSWKFIPKKLLDLVWLKFVKYGRVDERGLDKIWEILEECIIKLGINSDIGEGHDLSLFGVDEYSEVTENQWKKFFNFISDQGDRVGYGRGGDWDVKKGHARYSDRVKSLFKLAEKVDHSSTPEEKIMYIDQILNFVHGIGGMAKWFVEGGDMSLVDLSNKNVKGIHLNGKLSESPIDTFQTIGDFEKGKSFSDKRDREIVKNPITAQKVKDFFKDTVADFDFYFVNLQGRRKFTESRQVSEEFVFTSYPYGLGIKPAQLKNGDINSNNITIFFVGNTAAEKIPMTPWTIAHRLGHAISRTYGFEQYTKWLDSEFNNLLKLYNINQKYTNYGTLDRLEKEKANLFNQIGTMRSARQGKIKRYSEFYYELFAQYLKNGKIQFNKLGNHIQSGHAAYGRKNYVYTENVEEVNELLQGIERDIGFYIYDALIAIIGSIFVM